MTDIVDFLPFLRAVTAKYGNKATMPLFSGFFSQAAVAFAELPWEVQRRALAN